MIQSVCPFFKHVEWSFTVFVFFFSNLKYECNPKSADWARESRGVPLTSAPRLKHWLVFHTSRNCSQAKDLVEHLKKVSGPLGFALEDPHL